MKKCEYCNINYDNDKNFCENCGRPLTNNLNSPLPTNSLPQEQSTINHNESLNTNNTIITPSPIPNLTIEKKTEEPKPKETIKHETLPNSLNSLSPANYNHISSSENLNVSLNNVNNINNDTNTLNNNTPNSLNDNQESTPSITNNNNVAPNIYQNPNKITENTTDEPKNSAGYKVSLIMACIIIIVLVVVICLLLGSDFNSGTITTNNMANTTTQPENNSNNNSNTNNNTTQPYGRTNKFTFNNLEITVGNQYGLSNVNSPSSEYNGKQAIKLPVTVKNLKASTNSLNSSDYTFISPDNKVLTNLGAYFDDSINSAAALKVNETYDKYFYFLYSGKGTYKIKFTVGTENVDFTLDIT